MKAPVKISPGLTLYLYSHKRLYFLYGSDCADRKVYPVFAISVFSLSLSNLSVRKTASLRLFDAETFFSNFTIAIIKTSHFADKPGTDAVCAAPGLVYHRLPFIARATRFTGSAVTRTAAAFMLSLYK